MQTSGVVPDRLARARCCAARLADLDLALLLVNSHDLLEDPADRLRDLAWLTGVLTWGGHPDLGRALTAIGPPPPEVAARACSAPPSRHPT